MNRKGKQGKIRSVLCLITLGFSAFLNVVLMLGCRLTHPGPVVQPPSRPVSTVYLREIAEKVGIHPPAGRSAGDLAGDICIAIEEARMDVVKPIPPDSLKSMAEVLGPNDLECVRRQNDFIQSLAGRTLLVLPAKP